MNKFRQKRLGDQLDLASSRAIAAQEGYLEFDSRVTSTAILIGASVAGAVAVSNIKALDRLWGFQGTPEKAQRLLQTFALRLLSTWLGWMDRDRPEEDKQKARELWGEVFLTLFWDFSEDALTGFIGRDLQYRYETQVREEKREAGESGTPLVGTSLLLSDAMVALGGLPSISPAPVTGYPYEGLWDISARGGAKEAPFSPETLGDLLTIAYAVSSGAKVCADYYADESKKLDEDVEPVFKQLRGLLSEGYSLEALKGDDKWSPWVEFFEERGMLSS